MRNKIAWYKSEDGSIMVLVRNHATYAGKEMWGFMNILSGENELVFLSDTSDEAIKKAKECFCVVRKTTSIRYVLRREMQISPIQMKKIQIKVWHWITWLTVVAGELLMIVLGVPFNILLPVSLVWFGIVVFLVGYIVDCIVSADEGS